MRTLTRLTQVAVVLLAIAAAHARGQEAWATLSPEGEGFAVSMPGSPTRAAQQLSAGALRAEGGRYEAAGADGATYLVLSLKDSNSARERLAVDGYVSERFHREAFYLDAVAEMAWDVLVSPELERRKTVNRGGTRPWMAYRREFELGGRPAREYFVELGKSRGPVYVCVDGARIYVVAALVPSTRSAGLNQFIESFAIGEATPAVPQIKFVPPGGREVRGASAPTVSGGIGSGRGVVAAGGGPGEGAAGDIDYTRPFRATEVTQKARVTAKPEPPYTEGARKCGVTGTVTLRVILAASGKVERVAVITGLPHGLTWKAVEAVRAVRFEPAQKDGRTVSQYATFQYNFNIY
jgi:TonB family protein